MGVLGGSGSGSHLVAIDHVKSSISVPHGLALATSAATVCSDAGRRASRVVSAAALRVHQESGRRLRDHFACLARAARLELLI